MRHPLIVAWALLFVTLLPGSATAQAVGGKDIVDTAIGARFETLVAAVKAAGLVDTLKGPGPFTVFAPTDEAFAALPEGTLAELLLPENKRKLQEILTLHVVVGRLTPMEIDNIDAPQYASTVNGARLPVSANSGEFRFGDAKVVGANVRCTNGLIHVIDRVLLPKPPRDENSVLMALKEAPPTSLIEALRAVPDGRFSTFVAAVQASGSDQDWAQAEPQGNWTLFIPTNAAFSRLSAAELAALLDPANRALLREVLDWHALPRLQTWSFDFNDGQRGPAMISEPNDRFVLDVLCNGMVFVYRLRSRGVPRESEEPFKARIVAGDIAVGGNVVHVVDRVLLPPSVENRLVRSQAHREKDVEELAAGAKAQFRAVWVLNSMFEETQALDREAALPLYRFGLRMLEDIIPVSRNGMLIMGGNDNDAAQLRARLRTRTDELDRVWYGLFLKNSPTATSLSAPLPEAFAQASMNGAAGGATGGGSAAQPAVLLANTPAPLRAAVQPTAPGNSAPDLSWCELLEQAPDPEVVRDPALRERIVQTGLPWRVQDKLSGIELLLVPPGEFVMGKSPGDKEAMANELPPHSVTLTRAYYLSRFEVTRAEWKRSMESGGAQPKQPKPEGAQQQLVPTSSGSVIGISGGVVVVDQQGKEIKLQTTSERQADGSLVITTTAADPGGEAQAAETDPNLPILTSWKQAEAFCLQTGLRLPTEAEWEYACRAGVSEGRYGKLDEIAWHRGNSGGRKQPVGGKAANALGFHDMLGNAWEWVSDWYSEYTRAPKIDPKGPPTGTSRIIRGSYFEFEAGFCRASRRYDINSWTGSSTGLRVARTP
jgi:uncharacterized surface protein with fasciclin (FAS1) repeats/formylglycine-generating enzyme required for sulfatase activity